MFFFFIFFFFISLVCFEILPLSISNTIQFGLEISLQLQTFHNGFASKSPAVHWCRNWPMTRTRDYRPPAHKSSEWLSQDTLYRSCCCFFRLVRLFLFFFFFFLCFFLFSILSFFLSSSFSFSSYEGGNRGSSMDLANFSFFLLAYLWIEVDVVRLDYSGIREQRQDWLL